MFEKSYVLLYTKVMGAMDRQQNGPADRKRHGALDRKPLEHK